MIRFSIKTKILLGFASVLLFVGIIFIFSYLSISTGRSISAETSMHSLHMEKLNTLSGLLSSLEKQVDYFFTTPYEQYYKNAGDNLSEMQEVIDDMQKTLIEEDVSAFNSVYSVAQTVQGDIERIFPVLMEEANSQAKISRITNTDIKKLYYLIVELEEKINALFAQHTEMLGEGSLEQERILKKLMMQIVILSALFLFVWVGIAFFISRRISKPIIQLKLLSQDVAKGNFDIVSDIKTGDEIEDLAKSFNEMTSDLRFKREKLKEYGKFLEKRVEARTKELSGKNDELERVNKLMVGRELKMIELKKEIERLKSSSKEA